MRDAGLEGALSVTPPSIVDRVVGALIDTPNAGH